MLSCGGFDFLEEKLMEEVAQSESTNTSIDPPSPIRPHVKWKMARMKISGQITSHATKERIVSDSHCMLVKMD